MIMRNSVLAVLVVMALVFPGHLAASTVRPAEQDDDPRLLAALAHDGAADVLILLGPQPDLAAARTQPDKAARGQWVVDTLRTAAELSQRPLVAELQQQGVAYRVHWIVNAVAARLTAEQIDRVRSLAGVTAIVPDLPYRAIPEPDETQPAETAPDAIEWGVNRVNAPWAWSQGYTGAGVVVAGQDTGYDWDHPALLNAYRGYDPAAGTTSHDYNWHDAIHAGGGACGADSAVPCDDYGHGTHTMGTMAGNDLAPDSAGWPASATNAIGVAPGAQWIGCRNMDVGVGTPSTYIECFEWLVAPYPVGGTTDQGDPSKAPDIVNNSWGCPLSEGCTGPEIEPALNAADAAGILVVASAGNTGPSCGSVNAPPAIYPKAFTVGSVNSADDLAGNSSRGPATYNGQTLMKPNISAPGVSVRSSVPGTAYSTMSGTSMAGPHVAGVAALLISADPALRGQTDMLKEILARTADPKLYDACDPTPGATPNNGYGWGIVNAQRAIESLSQDGILSGTVTDAVTATPLTGATVTLYPAGGGAALDSQVTGADGLYSFSTSWGSYGVAVSVEGYDPASADPVYVVGGQTTTQDFALAAIPAVTDLSITRAGMDAQLSWTALSGNVAGYELWRDTTPYFVPGAGSAKIVADGSALPCVVSGTTITCTDAAVIGGPAVNHFYLVRAIGAGGGRSAPSGRVGEFDYLFGQTPIDYLPTGTLTVTTGPYACFGVACYDVQIQCPQLTLAIGATLRVSEPTSQPEQGTIVFFSGWIGNYYFQDDGEAPRVVSELRAAGYRTVDVKWASTWYMAATNQPEGLARLACRPATVTQWVAQQWRQPDVALPVCIYGHSNGATEVAHLLTRYGLADTLSVAMMDGGPNFSRLDAGCLQDDPQYSALWYDQGGRGNVDWSFGYPQYGAGPCYVKDVTWRQQFEDNSVALGEWQYVYPGTMVHFIFGELDQSVTRAHGENFYQMLTGVQTPFLVREVITGALHYTIRVTAGADAIRDGLIAGCQLH